MINELISGFLKIYMRVTDEGLLTETSWAGPENDPVAFSFVNVFIAVNGLSF